MLPENTDKIQASGRWRRGQSGNPAGRPSGARNRATLAAQAVLDGDAEVLTRRCVELALEGDTTALRLCLERILPPRREQPLSVSMKLPEGLQGVAAAERKLIAALASGLIAPGEASTFMNILKGHRDTLATLKLADAERLLETLRSAMEAQK